MVSYTNFNYKIYFHTIFIISNKLRPINISSIKLIPILKITNYYIINYYLFNNKIKN